MGLCCWLNWPWTWGFVVLLAFPFLKRMLQVVESVEGKLVLITGGSEGIGKCLGEEYARRGAHVVLLARTQSKLEAAVEECKKHATKGQKIGFVCTCVTDFESVKNAINKVVAEYGTPDILITAAGTSYPGYFLEQDPSVFEKTMTLNYMGNVNCIKAVAPLMVQRKQGKIMIVSSALAVVSFIGYGSYAPTKHALRGLADTLRSELKGFGIQVSICYPPDTDTPGFKRENELKPKETLACFPADAYSPEAVAKQSVNSFLLGDFHIQSPDILQNLLVSNLAGVTPRAFFFFEALMQPILCLVTAPFVWWFDFQAGKYAKRVIADSEQKKD